MWQLVNLRTDSIYLLHIHLNAPRQHLLFTAPTIAPVQLDLRLVGFCLPLGPATPWPWCVSAVSWDMAWQNLGLGLRAKREHRSAKRAAPWALLFYIDLVLIT